MFSARGRIVRARALHAPATTALHAPATTADAPEETRGHGAGPTEPPAPPRAPETTGKRSKGAQRSKGR
jgi:hypothetical protein